MLSSSKTQVSNTAQLANLISEVAHGNRAAFKELYANVSSRLFAICQRITVDPKLAEDALQETFMQVWRRAGTFDRARGSPLAWLTMIAKSRAIDLQRIHRRFLNLGDDILELPAEGVPPTIVYELSDLARCMKQLSENHGRAIRLVYYFGFTHGELARKLEIPLGTAKSWVRRGLAALETCLEL